MRLAKPIREHLRAEFRVAVDHMAGAPDLPDKLYFFSALFGEANRALNREWDRELALLHLVLSTAHGTIMARLSQSNPPGAALPGIPEEVPQALTETAEALAELLEEPEQDSAKLFALLARVAEIAYTTTGNGFYLYVKGAINF
jgi:hypothetical protein